MAQCKSFPCSIWFTLYGLFVYYSISAAGDSVAVAEHDLLLVRSTRASDQEVTRYVNSSLQNLQELLRWGIPELGVRPLDPIALDNFTYDGEKGHDSDGPKVVATFSNMSLYGLSGVEFQRIFVDMGRMRLAMAMRFANLTVRGLYEMHGRVLKVIPVNGRGAFYVEAHQVQVEGNSSLVMQSNGSLIVDRLQLDLDVKGDIKVHFHDLNGGGAVSGILNRIINFFGKSIFERAKPRIVKKMQEMLTSTINRRLRDINIFKMM